MSIVSNIKIKKYIYTYILLVQLEIVGRGGMLQARVLKLKKDLKNENNARYLN